MKIIEGRDIDLLTPFPTKELKRLFGWLRCYRTIPEIDTFPDTAEALADALSRLPTLQTFGIVDKNNFLGVRHEVPLIGMYTFDRDTMVNGNIHVASSRKAWNSRLVDQAGLTLINHMFRHIPELTRMTINCLSSNGPGRALAKCLGFRYEGCLRDAVVINNIPANMSMNGLTRTDWNEQGLIDREIEPVELEKKKSWCMGDFFGNLWQGLIGNGNQGGAGGWTGNTLNGLGSALINGQFGGPSLQAPGWMGGGPQGAPGGSLQGVDPIQGLYQGANVSPSPFESNNQQWTSNGPQSNWGTPVPSLTSNNGLYQNFNNQPGQGY